MSLKLKRILFLLVIISLAAFFIALSVVFISVVAAIIACVFLYLKIKQKFVNIKEGNSDSPKSSSANVTDAEFEIIDDNDNIEK